MVQPPPLVVRTLDAWYVLERSARPGSVESAWRHERAAGALAHWCAWVEGVRGGAVSLGLDCRRLIADVRESGAAPAATA